MPKRSEIFRVQATNLGEPRARVNEPSLLLGCVLLFSFAALSLSLSFLYLEAVGRRGLELGGQHVPPPLGFHALLAARRRRRRALGRGGGCGSGRGSPHGGGGVLMVPNGP